MQTLRYDQKSGVMVQFCEKATVPKQGSLLQIFSHLAETQNSVHILRNDLENDMV